MANHGARGSSHRSCPTAAAPPCLGSAPVLVSDGSVPITDPPILDPTTGKVFAFIGDSGSTSSSVLGVGRNSYVVPAGVDLTGVIRVNVGGAGAALHTGAF